MVKIHHVPADFECIKKFVQKDAGTTFNISFLFKNTGIKNLYNDVFLSISVLVLKIYIF